MAETSTSTRTRTSTIEERLRARRNEPRRGRGFLSLGPPESFSFFDRTRTRTRPPHEHRVDLAYSEELGCLRFRRLWTQKGGFFRWQRWRLPAVLEEASCPVSPLGFASIGLWFLGI
jgi:hypothetical protein